MNAVQMRERVDELIDRTKSARHRDRAYFNAINAAIGLILKDRLEPIRLRRKYSVQKTQRIRDELYTLIPLPATGNTLANGTIAYPSNYFYFLLVYVTINGEKIYCSPTSYNELGPLEQNPFSKPSVLKPYYNEYETGIRIYSTLAIPIPFELYYVKKPDVVKIGNESNKIFAAGAITNGAQYVVYEQAVYNGITVYEGDIFVGVGAAPTLTSGIVINITNMVDCNLPDNMHEEVCKQAASIMESTVEQFNKKQDLDVQVEKS